MVVGKRFYDIMMHIPFFSHSFTLFSPLHGCWLWKLRGDLHTTSFAKRCLNATDDIYDMRGLRTGDPLRTVFSHGLSHIHHTTTPLDPPVRIIFLLARIGLFDIWK